MTCPDVRARLVDLLYGELDEVDRAAVNGHLEPCADCRAAWSEVRSVASVLDRWTVPVPGGVAERVLARLAIREAGAARAQGHTLGTPHLLAFLLTGAAAAVMSLLLVGGALLQEQTSLEVGVAGAVWTAFFGVASFLTQHGHYRRLALAALIATGFSILFAPVLSMPAVIEACRRWLEAAQASTALNGAIVMAGALYGALPVFLSSAVIMRPRAGGIGADAVRVAGVYGLLLAPSVYLQCDELALALVAPWVAGVLLGSLLGSAGGVAVASRLHPVPA